MEVALQGFDGPLAQAVRAELTRRNHTVAPDADRLIYIPGDHADLARLLAAKPYRRVVLRSSVFVYGPDPKNPGYLTEDRGPILAPDAPGRRSMELEELALAHNAACLRMATILAPEEGDLIARQLTRNVTTSPFGRDPQVQFLSLADAARALVAAVESDQPGVFNIAGHGSLPLLRAYKAAGVTRIPAPPPPSELLARSGDPSLLEFNTTVSGDKARRALDFTPALSSVEALRQFTNAPADRLRETYDDWGFDLDYLNAWNAWFLFLQKVYWRVEVEGAEHVPAQGRALYVSNHRGFMPLDAVIHLAVVRRLRRRVIRFLIIHSLLRTPWLSNFLTKVGGVIANQENAARLFAEENLVGILPEGIRGAFTPYREAYQLRSFERSAFTRIAVEHQAPIIPAAVVGHAEIFPIIGRFDFAWTRRELGWPYFPIAPMFPLAPVPLPSKWHVRILPSVPVSGLSPQDASNSKLMRSFGRHIQEILQQNINDMTRRRKHIFFGKIFDGTHPPSPDFSPAQRPTASLR